MTIARPANLRVTERDLDVLDALGDYRFLSIPQLAKLFFASRGSAETRLRKLYEHELVVRVFMPVRPYDRHAHTIYALAVKGSRLLVARHDGKRPPHLSPHEQRSALHLDHTLRRNDLRICLTLLSKTRPGFELLTWQQAVEDVRARIWVKEVARTGATVPIVPDGVCELRAGGLTSAYAIEIDMGTVPPPRMETRYRAYMTWWRRGHAHRRHPAMPFRVLTLAPDARRCEVLRKAALAASNSKSGSGLFWFTTLANADVGDPTKLLGPVWSIARIREYEQHRLLARHAIW